MNLKTVAALAAAIVATSTAYAGEADKSCGANSKCAKKELTSPADAKCSKKEASCSKKEASCSKKEASCSKKDASCSKKDASCSKK